MRKILSVILCLTMVFICFIAPSSVMADDIMPGEKAEPKEYASDNEEITDFSSFKQNENGFIKVCENKKFALLYRESDAVAGIENKDTGYIWYTNPQNVDESISGNTAGDIKSQLMVQYYSGSTANVVDSYNYGIKNDNIPKISLTDNILTVSYVIGETEFTTDMLPPVMTKESMERDILSKLSEEDKAEVLTTYILYEKSKLDSATYKKVEISFPSIKKHDIYIMGSGLPSYIAKGIYEIFLKAGYSVDDLQKYCDENNIKNRYEVKPYFNIELQYILTDSGLTVSLDPKSITHTEKYPPTRIEILPFFGANDHKTKGFMIVPDGSGAVINMNNGKIFNNPYEKRIYDTDNSSNKVTNPINEQKTSLPFFAVSSPNGSFLATIDRGYEVAGVFADVAGRNTGYNRINSYFTLFSSDIITLSSNQSDYFAKYSEDIFSEKISVSYHFTNNAATYSELALNYREYLIKNEYLKDNISDNSSMNLSFMGAVEISKNFLGVPYNTMAANTSLSDIDEIIEKLNIKTADIRLTNFVEGGNNQKNVNSLKLQGAVGKLKNIKNLYASSDTTYLSLYSQYKSKASKSESSISLSQESSYKLNYNLINGYKEKEKYMFLISSRSLNKYSEKISKQIEKNDIEAINLRDIGYELNSDYTNNKQIDRYQARLNVQEYMKKLSAKAILSVDKGSIFALPFISKIWDIPMDGSNYHIEDYSIPFYQMAISGKIAYVAPTFSENSDVDIQFLRALEYGAQPQFTLISQDFDNAVYYKDDYYGYSYEAQIDKIKELNGRYSEITEAVKDAHIIEHKNNNGETSVTEYDNGVKIYINYTENEAMIGGKTVAPANYLLVK